MEILSFGAKSASSRNIHLPGPVCPSPLWQALQGQFPGADEPRVKWLVEFGAVYVNSKRVMKPHFEVRKDDVVRVHLDPKRYSFDRKDIISRVVSENDKFLIVNKPSGLPMHPTLDNFHENLAKSFDFPVFVTHRLDVPTSGLVLLAKTKEYQSLFNKLVASRGIRKKYKAFVQKCIQPGNLRHFMKVSVRAPKEVFKKVSDGQNGAGFDECLLEVLSSKQISSDIFEITIDLLTGRTHQIRAQLSAEGSPIIGDEMYGGIASPWFGLHATSLEFICPASGVSHFFEEKITSTFFF